MLQKHRSMNPEQARQADVSIEVDDDRSGGSIQLGKRHTASMLAQAHGASRAASEPDYVLALQRKFKRLNVKLGLATVRLNQIYQAGRDPGRATIALDNLNAELAAFLKETDPAQLLDNVMSDATRRAHKAHLAALNTFETAVRAGYGKHLWNLAAGSTGNFIAFGVGGLIATGCGLPLLSLPINTLLWTFTEPLVSMIRATTVTNPNLDRYMVRQRLQGRAAREAMDGTSALERNRRFEWMDPVSGDTVLLNAADWLARSSWLDLWSGKYVTDDVPTYLYSAAYGVTNSLPEFTSRHLYQTPGSGIWLRAGLRTVAGVAAGAALQESTQLLRALMANRTGGKEIVTKTATFWKQEADVIRMILNDIKNRQINPLSTEEERHAYATLHRSFTLWHEKAIAKSGFFSSIAYEWGAMLQSKREAIGIDPEVPGKRLYTAASFIGKGMAQLPGVVTSQLAESVVKSPVRWIRWTGYLVPPLAMIGAAGFIARRELEVIAHTMLSALHGVGRRCCPHEAEE